MRIAQININSQKYQNKNSIISFEAMKKADFRGFDYAVLEKFKAPIEKFDVLSDFQNWAGGLVEKIKNTNFLGRKAETVVQRKGMLKDWFNYVIEENGAYTKAIQLLILSAMTKNLGEKDDNLPPTLNKGVLADCVSDLNKELEKDKKVQFDFNKMYQNKLRAFYSDDTKSGESGTKWVVIPSKEHDSKNFESNVEKLKTLSHKSWCTKSYNAEPYLKEGDFHVYLENGEPKIGIRFIGNKIQEIQGELNDSKIPVQYFDVVKEHINNLELRPFALEEIKEAEYIKQKIEKIKQDLTEAIKTNDVVEIYKYFGIKVEKDENAKLILSKYKQPDEKFKYKDLGIDEDKLFENVVIIKGNADFYNSDLTSLHNLKEIKGYVHFAKSNINDLGNLESIGGNVNFFHSKILNLGKLKLIGGNANFSHSQVKNLGNLEEIGGYVELNYSEISNLGNLQLIGGSVDFGNSKITDLGNLQTIIKSAYFGNSKITNLGNLQFIGEEAYFGNSKITNLENLQSIGGQAFFNNSKVTNLGKLKEIKGSVHIKKSKLKSSDFKNIKVIGKIR